MPLIVFDPHTTGTTSSLRVPSAAEAASVWLISASRPSVTWEPGAIPNAFEPISLPSWNTTGVRLSSNLPPSAWISE